MASLLTLTTPSITLTNLAYTLGGTLSGTVNFSCASASLEFGSALDASAGAVNGSYSLGSGNLSLDIDNFSLNLANVADLTAATISLTYTAQASATETPTPNFGSAQPLRLS